jgi:hypothetical protein
MKKQFTNANCGYGAPLGRREYGLVSDCPEHSIRLFKVRLIGDYDDGGAYWGASISIGWLYCARSGNTYRRFVRANSRTHARELLRIPNAMLIRGTV